VVYSKGYKPPANKKSSAKNYTGDGKTHTVKSGESLALIANKYDCSKSDLKKWNNLNSEMIHPNQKLLVQAPEKVKTKNPSINSNKNSGNFVYHTVRKGDTLWGYCQPV